MAEITMTQALNLAIRQMKTEGKSALIKVRASGPGTLVAWFDFNGNGVFDTGALQGEAFGPFVVEEGINQFAISVPADAQVGDTFARFRLSSDSGAVAEPAGEAPDGEVEDYLVAVAGAPGKPLPEASPTPEEEGRTQ